VILVSSEPSYELLTLHTQTLPIPEEPNVFLAELLIDILELVELLLQRAALVLLLIDLLLLLNHPCQRQHLCLQGKNVMKGKVTKTLWQSLYSVGI